jgi:hypothetical protein
LRYENTLARLDKKFRGNLRRARNRLQELDGVSVVTARSPEELAKAFSGFLQVEGSGWKGRKGTGSAIRLHPNVTKFYDLLWKGFAEQGRAAINLLLHMEKPIAGQFCLLIDDCCYVLKIGYDEDHAKLAPGNMLLEFLLKQYQDCSSVTNINLITSHDWQQSWKPDLVRVQELSLFNRSPKGIVLYSLNRTKNALRPWCTAPGSFGATT